MKKIRQTVSALLFANLYSAFNLTGTETTGTYVNRFRSSVYNSLYFSDVRLPGSVGLAVGVGNVVTERYAFSADITLSHFQHLRLY